MMRFKTSWDDPENLLPEFQFKEGKSHEGFGELTAAVDFPSMRMQTLRKGAGELCAMDNWAVINYKAYLNGEDADLIHNSRKSAAGEGSKKFRVGNYEVSKCWDMAV